MGPPRIGLDGESVLVDDQPVSSTVAGRTGTLDALAGLLNERRRSQPTASNESYWLSIAYGVDAERAKSVIAIAASAGWPHAILDLGMTRVLIHTDLPLDTQAPGATLFWPEQPLVVIIRNDSVQLLRVERETGEVTAAASRLEPARFVAESKLDNTQVLRKLFRSECRVAASCSPLVLFTEDGVEFATIKAVLATIQREAWIDPDTFTAEWRMAAPPPAGQPVYVRVVNPDGLSPELIQHVIRAEYGRLRDCYEIALRKNPNLEGRLLVGFVIDRNGRVASAQARSETTLPAAPIACMIDVFRTLVFPPPKKDEIRVAYPIQFSRRP